MVIFTSFKLQGPDFDSFTQTEFEVYHIEYTYISTVTVAFIHYPAGSYAIGDLLNAAEYSIRVGVNNSAGLGEYSSPPVTAQTIGVGMFFLQNLVLSLFLPVHDIVTHGTQSLAQLAG